jgi:hypothetical protein
MRPHTPWWHNMPRNTSPSQTFLGFYVILQWWQAPRVWLLKAQRLCEPTKAFGEGQALCMKHLLVIYSSEHANLG